MGATANVVMVELARKNGLGITFWSFLKHAAPLTLISLALSSVYIQVRYF